MCMCEHISSSVCICVPSNFREYASLSEPYPHSLCYVCCVCVCVCVCYMCVCVCVSAYEYIHSVF